ncbi:type III secretion system cytoplasmic ring protein SctQ [Paraburkholderia sediminicola]|uniref:type III secretion system cytoplasmic ring protein SctQ n=1 Tax=Paraburkholderia sediminicola TaxID=458836 RepID=UPI0038B9CB94
MLISDIDQDSLELWSIISAGRISQDAYDLANAGDVRVELRVGSIGGEGIIHEMTIEGEPLQLWYSEQEWCKWIDPLLPIPRLIDAPTDIMLLLATWTAEPLAVYSNQHSFGRIICGGVYNGHVDNATACVISLSREHSRLDARILLAPGRWLRHLATSLKVIEQDSLVSSIFVALSVGWTRVQFDQIKAIEAGGALVLDTFSEIEKGELFIYHGRPFARVTVPDSGEGRLYIEEVCSFHNINGAGHEPVLRAKQLEQLPCRDGEIINVVGGTDMDEDLTVVVVAEIAQIPLSLKQLGSLTSGMVLETPAISSSGVRLSFNGQTIARGQLVRLGDRLAVRID